jgi:PKHD-type hydroxylase
MYYSWVEAISKGDCEDIILKYKDSDFKTAEIVQKDNQPISKISHRDTQVTWIKSNSIIERMMASFVLEANYKYFGFDLTNYENVQFAKYSKGGLYDWHTDYSGAVGGEKQDRKLSCTIQLSDPNSYEGGDLQFYAGVNDPDTPNVKGQGSVIVFASHDWHRVTPVTKGVRYSLTLWFLGPHFK